MKVVQRRLVVLIPQLRTASDISGFGYIEKMKRKTIATHFSAILDNRYEVTIPIWYEDVFIFRIYTTHGA